MRLLLALILLATPATAQAQLEPPSWGQAPSPAPSWREAVLGGTATVAGAVAGGYAGGLLGAQLGKQEGSDWADVVGAVMGMGIGATVGATAGAYVAKHRLTGGRGSVLGATVGALGSAVAVQYAIGGDDNLGERVLVAIPVGIVGGALGYRLGPWARGPARVAVSPVVSHDGQGVYAVVRF